MADVIAIYMVVDGKTTEADVIAYYIFNGWCYCQYFFVADAMTICCSIRRWQMLLPGSSDFRKPELVPGESLSPATIFGSVLKKINYTCILLL